MSAWLQAVVYPDYSFEIKPEIPRPPHAQSGCTQCRVAEKCEDILLWYCTKEMRDAGYLSPHDIFEALRSGFANEKKVLDVGHFYLPGWTGHEMFYLFHCPTCLEPRVDYIHGRRRLNCWKCGKNIRVRGERFEIYDKEPEKVRAPEGSPIYTELIQAEKLSSWLEQHQLRYPQARERAKGSGSHP